MWSVYWEDRAKKQISKLDKKAQKQIHAYIQKRIEQADNPRLFGDALTGNLSGLWRYRVGNYRIICEIEDEKLTILVIKIGHRKDIYH